MHGISSVYQLGINPYYVLKLLWFYLGKYTLESLYCLQNRSKYRVTAWMTATVLDHPGKVDPNMSYIVKQTNQTNKTKTTQNQAKTNSNNKKGCLV